MEKKVHQLRVLSYNIHKGFSSNNRVFVLRRIREAIRSVHADLVFLQEVIGNHDLHKSSIDDWPDQPQFEFLADELWPHYAYGKNAVYSAGHHGNAILSKYPFVSWENIDVSTSRFERRGILHGTIRVPGRSHENIHVICVHLGLFEADRKKQIRLLASRIESHVRPHDKLIICGDFNDWRIKASHVLESKLEVQEAFAALKGNHARSYPSWLPALRLDRVYFRGLKANHAQALNGRPWSELSDHLALYVEFVT